MAEFIKIKFGSQENMNNIEAYVVPGAKVKIEQTKVQRDWMNLTDDRHAYKCFPISLANSIGYSISFLEDIEFVWDGISDSSDTHVKIIRGMDSCTPARGNGTISFHSGISFKTDPDVSMLSIVPPNYFIDGATPFTSIISTSFHDDMLPVAWKITRPNVNIIIPAGTPVITIIPISLKNLTTFELNLHDKIYDENFNAEQQKKLEVWEKISKEGGFTNFYRDAVDYNGNSIGEHEVKSIVLKINDKRAKEG
jgi:hypothetical protein